MVVRSSQRDYYGVAAGDSRSYADASAIGQQQAEASQAGSRLPIFYGTGAPATSLGANGEFYFRLDGGSGTTIYQKRSGAWVGVV